MYMSQEYGVNNLCIRYWKANLKRVQTKQDPYLFLILLELGPLTPGRLGVFFPIQNPKDFWPDLVMELNQDTGDV